MMDTMDIYEMKALLKDFLQRGRYAIVLDDVWDTEFWDAFKFVLPENSHGGNRVMLTTRKADVASASSIESNGYVHKMGCLNFEDSWTLFCRKTFKDRGCPTHLKNVARSIVVKCGGLPLAIVAISGLMVTKDSSRTNEWELVQRRLGDEFDGSRMLDRVKSILSLSYNDLSSTLKACFLYTSIFPEDYRIPCLFLINLWVAEHFVQDREGQTAEEIAWNHLKELANRSLIQLNQVLYNGLYSFVHIHDVLREFIASKSREQNMVAIINTTKQIRRGCPSGEVIRRLVFHHNLPEIISPESNISNVRAIFSFGQKMSPSKALLTKLLTRKLLTVLDMTGIELEEIPEEVFRLFHLKYLGLTGKRIKKISKSIKGLQNLECLTLKDTNIMELPMEIKRLHKLRHLLFYDLPVDTLEGGFLCSGFKAPPGMGQLRELQTLCSVDLADSDKTRVVSEIGKLVQLRKLWINNLRIEDGKELCSSLEKLTNLQELTVGSSAGKDEAVTLDLDHPVSASFLQSVHWLKMFGRSVKSPPWIRNLQGLERITLILSNLLNDPLETLQLLPNLFELWFEAYQGEGLCFNAGGFLKLKKLSLKLMNGLRWLRVEKGAMPGMSQITMQGLPLLEEIPSGIKHLRQLEKLELWGMSYKLTDKLENATDNEEESEDRIRISHIPQVILGFKIDGRWRSCQLSPRKKAEAKKETDQLQIQVEQTMVA